MAARTAARPGPTRTELFVVREDGVWRVPLDQRTPKQVAVARIGGRYKLGFASAVENVGRGPVWIRGTRSGRTMTARQLVRVGAGRVESHVDAGVHPARAGAQIVR